MIEISNLSKSYKKSKKAALEGVNLSVADGEVFGLIGPNGAGKTTLMQCMLGLIRPTSGQVLINGMVPDHLEVKRLTAFLPERPLFDGWMTARQFLHYHHMLARQPQSKARDEVESALDLVALDQEARSRRLKSFSRGMLQKLGLAQMVIGKPKLCFLDEPTSGLDPISRNLVRNLILRWKQSGATVVLNSHHLDEVERVCDRVAFIRGGCIQTVENTRDVDGVHIPVVVMWTGPQDAAARIREISEQTMFECTMRDDNSATFIVDSKQQIPRLVRSLVDAQIDVEQVFVERTNLERLFELSEPERTVV